MILMVFLVTGFSFAFLFFCYYFRKYKLTKRHHDVASLNPVVPPKLVDSQAYRFFNLSLDMLAIGTLDGYFTQLNPAWEKTLGFTLQELQAQPFIEFIHPADVEATQTEMEKLGTGIPLNSFENRYRCKDGSYKWLSWTAAPFLEEGLIYGVARDISDDKQAEAALQKANEELETRVAERTAHLRQVNDELVAEIVERRQVEIALRKSEALYRTLIETIPDGIVEIDTAGIITFNNWTYERLFGYADGELIGKSLLNLTLESEGRKLVKCIARQVQDQPPPTPYVGKFLTKDGKLIDIQADWNYKRDEQGKVTGFISVTTDITERKRMEEALRSSEERFRVTLKNSPIIVFHQDTELRYTWIYNSVFRLDANKCIGKWDSELFASEDVQRLSAIKRRVLTTGVGTRQETALTFNGEVRYYDLTIEPLHNQAGDIVGITCAATDITDIHAREQELRAIFEGTLEAIFIVDNEGKYVAVNPAFCKLLGVPPSQLLGRRLESVIASGVNLKREWCTLLQQGQATGELCLQHSDGSLREVEYAAKANFLPGRHLAVLRDITKRKQAEAAQRKTEHLYRTLASNFPNGVVALFDKDLRYTLAEGKGLEEVGLSKEFLEGKTVAEIFPLEVSAIKEQAYRTALNGTPNICEIPFGEQFYLMYALPLRNEQGEIYAGMSMSQNISDRKRAELALLEERNFVSAILDTAGALIVVYDRQGRFIRVNRACEQISGYPFSEMKDQYIWDLFLIPEEIEPAKAIFQELQAGQFPIEYESYWVTRDGRRRLISWSNTVILDADSSVKYIISIGIDITERKQTEEIRRALERAQELSELRLRFFSMVSHEFRTPLSTILVSAQTLLGSRAQEWPEEKRKKSLCRIESAAKHLTQLLDDVLTINRAETGKLDVNPKPLNLEIFCRSLLEEIQLQASNQHIINFVSQGNCRTFCLDEILLRSILNNLLSNAIKYSPQGGEIQLGLTCKYKEVIFQIRDPGIGILGSDLIHIFEPFHRGNNVGNIPGTGLGITVVKKCLDLQGGKIAITSEVGMGTTVTVTIPVV